MATKTQALAKIARTAQAAAKAAERAEDAQNARDHAIWLARQCTDPASYQEIADAAEVSKDRISQIIQVQRALHSHD